MSDHKENNVEQQTACDECGAKGRLHVDRDHDAVIMGRTRPWLLCDDCWEKANPGTVAVCEDHCSLPLDHIGVCRS